MVKTLVLALYASQVFSGFLPLNRIALRRSGPIPIGILDKEATPVEEEGIEVRLSAVQPSGVDSATKKSAVVGGRYAQDIATHATAKKLNPLNDKLLDIIYPFTWFTWYCVSRSESSLEE